MTRLKPCPFCDAVPEENPKGRTQCSCTIGYMLVEQWNSRPTEDRLRAALEEILELNLGEKHWDIFGVACKALGREVPENMRP